MIIGFQLSIFSIHIGISLLWWLSKKTRDYQTSFFRYVLISSDGMIIANFIYTIFEIYNIAPGSLVLINRINRVFIICTLHILFFYVLSKAIDSKIHSSLIFPLAIVPLIASIITLSSDSDYLFGLNTSNIVRGYSLIYIYSLLVIILLIAILIVFRKKINKWYVFITNICIVFLGVGIIFHFFLKGNGVIETSIVLSIAIVFLTLENPVNKLDYRFSCYKPYYIVPCINRYLDNKINGFAVMIGFKLSLTNEEVQNELYDFQCYLINQIRSVPECETFITNQRDIFVLCDNISLYDDFIIDLKEDINDYLFRIKNNKIKTAVVSMENIKEVTKANYLLKSMNKEKDNALNLYSIYSNRTIDNNDVKKQENEVYLENLLIENINNDSIDVCYLPIYNLKDNKCTSAEAIINLIDNNKTITVNEDIIRVGENTGLIMDICYKCFDKVCSFVASQKNNKRKINTIFYHLFNSQIKSSYVIDILIETCKKYEIDPKSICLGISRKDDILEYGAAKDTTIADNINKLHDFGFLFSIDGYCTQDSDYMDLVNLPISYIKIDKSVLALYFDTLSVQKTLNQLLKIAHEYGIYMIACGVDRVNQYDGISENGIDFAQGAYFSNELSENELNNLIKPSIFDVDK